MSFTCCHSNSWFNELRFSWFYFLRLSSTAGCSCSLSNGPQSSRRFNLWDANTSSQLSRGWCSTSIEHKRAAVLLSDLLFFFLLLCLGCSVFSRRLNGWCNICDKLQVGDEKTGLEEWAITKTQIFPPLVFWWDFEEVAHCEELKVLFLQHTLKRLNRLCKIGNMN